MTEPVPDEDNLQLSVVPRPIAEARLMSHTADELRSFCDFHLDLANGTNGSSKAIIVSEIIKQNPPLRSVFEWFVVQEDEDGLSGFDSSWCDAVLEQSADEIAEEAVWRVFARRALALKTAG